MVLKDPATQGPPQRQQYVRKAVLAQRSCPWPAGKSWCGCVAGDAWGRGCYARVGEGLWGALGVPPLLPGVGWAMVFA